MKVGAPAAEFIISLYSHWFTIERRQGCHTDTSSEQQQLTRLEVVDGVHGLENHAGQHLDTIQAALLRGIQKQVTHVFGLLDLDGKAEVEVALQVAHGLAVQVLQTRHVAVVGEPEAMMARDVETFGREISGHSLARLRQIRRHDSNSANAKCLEGT